MTPNNTDFRQWQIQHYTERLAAERAKGNVPAISFLRGELKRLKQTNNE